MSNRTSLLIVALLVASAAAMYDDDSSVVKLTQTNFKQKVLNSDQFWFVEFYAPWCGHCKKAAPQFEQAARILDGIVNIGAVDMTTDHGAGAKYGISGYPTIKLFAGDKKNPIDFSSSERTYQKFVEFCMNHLKKEIVARKKNVEKERKREEL